MCASCIFSNHYTSSLSAWSVHHQHCMHGVHHISVQSICHHHHSTQKCIITLIVHQNSTQTTESILLNTSLYSSLTAAQHDVYITMLGISQSVYHSTLSKHHHECSIGLHTLLYISQTSHTWAVCVSLFSTELCTPSSDLLGLHFTFYYCKQLRVSNIVTSSDLCIISLHQKHVIVLCCSCCYIFGIAPTSLQFWDCGNPKQTQNRAAKIDCC